jgi:hypothetical protein
MSDHDTIPPEIDDEIGARLQTFARQVAQRADTEAALRRMPRRSRPPTIRLIAIAACLLGVVGSAVVIRADRQSVDTTDPSDPPTATIDGRTTLARGIVEFVEAPEPGGCCVPPGGGLPVPAGQGLGGQTMDISAEEADGTVTGQARFTLYDIFSVDHEGFAVEVEFECADTGTGDVILGGTVTTASGEGHSGAFPPVGALMAVIIREGEPDRATVWWATRASSCRDFLESVPEPRPDDRFVVVADGDDIETGG